MRRVRGWALAGVAGAGLVGLTTAAGWAAEPWQLEDGPDPFSDLRVVRASAATDAGDAISVTCQREPDDENLALVTVFAPAREIRADEFTVRYRIDDNEPVVSGLAWENFNGRARSVLGSSDSLFGELSQTELIEEFRLFGEQLMAGGELVIEADGERATFRLTRSGTAMEAVMAACEGALEVAEE